MGREVSPSEICVSEIASVNYKLAIVVSLSDICSGSPHQITGGSP